MGTNNDLMDFMQQAFAGFDACLSDAKPAAVVVAVSGGSDSMALLLLSHAYFKERFPFVRMIAATVDHQLRAESGQEAEDVAGFCRRLGIPHHILPWAAVKPSTGISAAAREARYDLLIGMATALGADFIFTGHTADDQVETYLMRRQRIALNSDPHHTGRGLAVMAPQTLLQNRVLLCRPLLGIWRESLRDYLRDMSVNWFDDPSNDNLAYERPRMRELAKQVDKQAVLKAVGLAASRRKADNKRVALLLNHEALQNGERAGDYLFLADGWDEGFTDVVPLALSYMLSAIGGKTRLPSMNDCEKLVQKLELKSARQRLRQTLHHCVVEKTAKGLKIWREQRNLPVSHLQAGETLNWDGRFKITNKAGFAVTIAAVNKQQLTDYIRLHEIDATQIDRESLLSSPAIWINDRLEQIPALSVLAAQNLSVVTIRSFACFDRVLSGYDFEVAKRVKSILTMTLNHKYH